MGQHTAQGQSTGKLGVRRAMQTESKGNGDASIRALV